MPELKGWEVWAADGHKIAHATQAPRNAKDQYNPSNAIYKLDLRTGACALRCDATKGQHTLLAYDRAVSDFRYASNLKPSQSSYLITRWQDHLAPVTTRGRPFDRTNQAHELIISDETVTVQDTPGTGRKLTARAPDRDEIHTLLSNEMTLPPGVLSECYRLRWRIEQTFDQPEQKLDERKA